MPRMIPRFKLTHYQQGTPLAEADLRIAAIAITRDLALVTGNSRHFGRIADLTIENWP